MRREFDSSAGSDDGRHPRAPWDDVEPLDISATNRLETDHRQAADRMVVVAMGIVAVAAALWRNARTVVDVDLWGHVIFGHDKLAARGYLSTDTYSYLTEGRTWFNHEWGGEVLMASAYLAAGSAGLVLLKLVVVVIVVGAVYAVAVRTGLAPLRAAALTLVPTALLAPTFGTVRPQLVGLIFLTAVMLVLWGAEDRPWSVVVLPVLVAVWFNTHGGAVAGLALIGAWWATRSIRQRWVAFDATTVAVGLSTLAVVFVHPLGWRHLRFLLETATVSRPAIQDWQPIDLMSGVGIVYAGVAVGAVWAVVARRHLARWELVVPMLVALAGPLVATRHLQIAAVAVPILGVHLLAGAPLVADATDRVVSVVLAAVLVVPAAAASVDSLGCIAVDPAQFDVPVAAVAALEGLPGPLIVPFNWGEFAIWELNAKVSIDGRRETVYSEAVYRENLAFEFGVPGWAALLERGEPAAAILPSDSATVGHLANLGWAELHRDPTATVMAPVAFETAPVRGPHDGAGLCFPDEGRSVIPTVEHGGG